jgi:hypothetical protein
MPKCEHVATVYRFQLGEGTRRQVIEVLADHGDDPQDTTFEVPPVSDMTRDELRDYANHLLRLVAIDV